MQQVLAESDSATLRVIVASDEDGNPIPGANVILSTEQDTVGAGSTNSDGYVQISDLQPGDYNLEVSFLGYQSYQTDVSLSAGQTALERVRLSADVEQLDEVVVEAADGAAYREAGRQTVSPQELGRIPSPGPGGDLAMYLQSLPGVVSSGDRGGEMFIRGGTPSQNVILMDNIPLTQPFHISNLFSAFPEEALQDVEFYAGGFGAEYTGGTSSVIDVSLRQGNMREFSGEVAASPYLVSAFAEGPIVEDHQSLLVSARSSVIDQTAEPLSGEEVPIDFYDILVRYTNELPNLTCSVTGMHTYDEGQINPLRDVNLSWTNTALGGRCLLFDASLDHAFDISVGISNFTNTEGTLDNVERESSVQRIHLRLDRDYDYLGLPISYGLRFDVARFQSELDERFVLFDEFDSRMANFQAFASATWEPIDNLTVVPGLTSQISTGLEVPTLEPRLRLSYQPFGSEFQEFSLAAGRYYQLVEGISDERDAGTVFNVWKPMDTMDHPEPWAWHGIVGFRQRLANSFEATIEGYIKDQRNIPVSKWTPEARLEIETAFADGFTYGADARIEYDSGPLHLMLGYDWSKVNYEASTGELGAWIDGEIFSYNPAHDRRHQFSAMAGYDIFGVTTSVRWEYGTGQPYTRIRGNDMAIPLPDQNPATFPGTAMTIFEEPFGDRLPSTHRLDVSMEREFQLSPRVVLGTEIGAINIYDRNNIFYYDSSTFERVDQMPFLPYFAVSASFN